MPRDDDRPEARDRGDAAGAPVSRAGSTREVDDTVADAGPPPGMGAVVRRLELFALLWGLAWMLPLLLRGELRAALVLTLAVAASIFHVRSLRTQVARLDPRLPGSARVLLGALGRYAILTLFLVILLRIGAGHPTAVVVGVATLPAALLGEALWEAVGQARFGSAA